MDYICQCNKKFKSSQSLNAHYSWCKIHGKGRVSPTKGKVSYRRGKNFEEIYGIDLATKYKEKLSKSGKSAQRTGIANTVEAEVERRRKLSVARMKYLESSPHVDWYSVGGIKVQGKWERDVGLKLIKDNVIFLRKRVKYDTHRTYTPDFYLVHLNVYLEVKGWLRDRDIDKYRRVYTDNQDIRILIIHGKTKLQEFLDGTVGIQDLPDLRTKI